MKKLPGANVPLRLTDANFHGEVIESELPVLVDMWAPWCGPCIEMKPMIQQLAQELQGEVNVAELNIDDNLFIKEKYDVDRYPMLLLFVDGNEIARFVGVPTKESLLNSLRESLKNEVSEN